MLEEVRNDMRLLAGEHAEPSPPVAQNRDLERQGGDLVELRAMAIGTIHLPGKHLRLAGAGR